ncbi:hypothetical protein MKX96_12250 [Psychrobacillus sp. FSL W7-1493]|uniref:hypothetical protein n=1 Tax=Psychrobacillus sp. FSL W7-1493 TaxID=2921552 RepID=UPI00260622CD|nr:hypothetical protein [uncultured Psychrobacillus sp.]
MIILIIYIILDTFIVSFILNGSLLDRIILHFCFQQMISGLSLLSSSLIIGSIIALTQANGLLERYFKYLLDIAVGDISQVGGNIILQLIFSICALALIIYSLFFYLFEKHLLRIGIISLNNLRIIRSISAGDHLNNIYTIAIFWLGFIPLAAEVLGNSQYKIQPNIFLLATIAISIPYTHLNIVKRFSRISISN